MEITDEQKRVFWGGNSFFNYEINFAEIDTVIDCEQIQSETVRLTESICENEEMLLGGCIASCCEFDISEMTDTELAGLQFFVTLSDLEGKVSLPMGVYRVDTAKRVDDKDCKHIIAYDALYDASVDVSGWYNGIFPDEDSRVTIGDMRCSLLEYLGMSYVKQSLANDSLEVGKTIEPEGLTGTDVLKAICTINGAFGKINREGLFEEIYPGNPALFPEENLYPSEDLYPEDTFEYLGIGDKDAPEYREIQYEEYTTKPITCVSIQSDDTDTGVTAGEDTSNPYVISGNFLLYGLEVNTLRNVAEEILHKISGIVYRPCTVSLCGLPYVETGAAFALEKRTDIVESIVFTRTLTGIQELIDTFEAKGSELRMNEVMPDSEIIRMNHKILNIQKNVDVVSVEMLDMEKEMSSKIEQTAEGITQTVAKAQSTWDETGWNITAYGYGEPEVSSEYAWGTYYLDQETGYVYSYGTQNDTWVWTKIAALPRITEELSSRIAATATQIELEVKRAQGAEGEISGKINIESDRITAEVSRAQSAEGGLSSRLTITENSITTKVSKGDVVSEINQSPEKIELKANRLIVESNGFTLDGNGNAAFSGTITGGVINGTTLNGVNIEAGNVIVANKFYEINGSTPTSLIKDVWVLDDNGGHKNISTVHNIPSISYCNAAYVKVSDYRIKKNTTQIPEEMNEVFDSLRPIQYEFKDCIKAWKGKHFGELAQRIRNLMDKAGLDAGEYGLIGIREPDKELGEEDCVIDNKLYYINNEEVTWLCVWQIQRLKKRAETAEKKVADLEDRVYRLEAVVEKLIAERTEDNGI